MAPMNTAQTIPVRLGWTARLRPEELDDFADGFRAKGGFLEGWRTVSEIGHRARLSAGFQQRANARGRSE
jgi:hypothetical protein